MIVGNGLIAKAFYENYVNNDDVLIFASGVSNSSNTDPKEFLREKTLLESHLSEQKKIVYFSTCSIEDPSLENSPYILHKLEMEQLVKESKNYLILRLPQLAGRTDNPNTLLNFLYNKIKNEEKFFAHENATRNIVDIEDVYKIGNYLVNENISINSIVNIASPSCVSIFELINLFEGILERKGNYELIKKGSNLKVDSNFILNLTANCNVNFSQNYTIEVVEKYYKSKDITNNL